MMGPSIVPASIMLEPSNVTLLDTVPKGTLVSTAKVTMSDGSTNYGGTLTVSDPQFTVQGLNIITAAPLTPDGTRTITVTAN